MGFDKTGANQRVYNFVQKLNLGLYLDCLMEKMPLGAPGIYSFDDKDPERPAEFEPPAGLFDLTAFPESDIEVA